jgi:hypothetical protein
MKAGINLSAAPKRVRATRQAVKINPMTLDEVRRFRPKIIEIDRRRRICGVQVFGSVARGDAGPDSEWTFSSKLSLDGQSWLSEASWMRSPNCSANQLMWSQPIRWTALTRNAR